MTSNIYKIFVVIFVITFFLSGSAYATNVTSNCNFNSGTICTNVSDNLAQDATGVDPAQSVELSFSVYKQGSADAPDCNGSRTLYHAVRHYINGDLSNYEYRSAGSGQDISYSFNSGVDQQRNRYAGVFYCWTTSQGTDKSAVDLILGQLGVPAEQQTWSSPEFNQTTRVVTINPDCTQITSCANYPVRNDCEANRCSLTPSCRWISGACVGGAQISPSSSQPPASGSPISGGNNLPGEDLTIQNVLKIINGIACWLIRVITSVMVIFLVFIGFKFMNAQGDPGKITDAKKSFNNVLIGIVVIMSAYVIIATVANAVGVKDFSFIPLVC